MQSEKKQTLKVAVPPGIGDALWSMTKIESIMQKGGYEKCTVSLQDTRLNRGKEFIEHFDFVDSANYEPFPIQHPGATFDGIASKGASLLGINNLIKPHSRLVEVTGEYIYIDSQKNFLNMYDWLLIANGHLERGNRIETWLPEFDTNLDLGLHNFKFTEEEEEEAAFIHDKFIGGGAPFILFYLGPKVGNTTNGHNRDSLWSLQDWYDTAILFKEHNPSLQFVITGANYDVDYVADFLYLYYKDFPFINLAGLTDIGVTFALIKRAKVFLSYQCGLGIFSVYLGVPTVCWWRPYGNSFHESVFISVREEMASAWAPEWSLGPTGNYLPSVYTKCTPESIFKECVNRKWI